MRVTYSGNMCLLNLFLTSLPTRLNVIGEMYAGILYSAGLKYRFPFFRKHKRGRVIFCGKNIVFEFIPFSILHRWVVYMRAFNFCNIRWKFCFVLTEGSIFHELYWVLSLFYVIFLFFLILLLSSSIN